jgi:hypothetical protein
LNHRALQHKVGGVQLAGGLMGQRRSADSLYNTRVSADRSAKREASVNGTSKARVGPESASLDLSGSERTLMRTPLQKKEGEKAPNITDDYVLAKRLLEEGIRGACAVFRGLSLFTHAFCCTAALLPSSRLHLLIIWHHRRAAPGCPQGPNFSEETE